MKEIKFRIWDKKEHKMIRCAYDYKKVNYFLNLYGEIEVFERPSNRARETGVIAYVKWFYPGNIKDRLVLMQYTGLKDKDGQEIYEGDIIEHWRYNDEKMKEIVVVENLVDFLKFVGFREIEYGEDWSNGEEYIKVLGNIYENPELLKGGEICNEVITTNTKPNNG
jgi:uncharacterized phage protein (TIGR01671 family)